MDIHEACKRLKQQHDSSSLTLLNLNGRSIGTAGVKSLLKSHCIPYDENNTKPSSSDLPPLLPTEGSQQAPTSSSSGSPLPFIVLWMENNEIYAGGAKALEQVVAHSPRLEYLYMAHNSIGNSGAQALGPTALSQVRVLNLADNEIGPEGARAVGDCLSGNYGSEEEKNEESSLRECRRRTTTVVTTTTLILESNKLGDKGAACLAEGLRHNTSLEEVDLRFNKIGVLGLTAIRDCLIKDNTTLQRLYLEEEEDDKHCKQQQQQQQQLDTSTITTSSSSLTQHPPRKQIHLVDQRQRCPPMKHCRCSRCKLRLEISYYLALNRAGRHSFGNTSIHSGLYSRIVGRISDQEDPSLLYTLLTNRPDILR